MTRDNEAYIERSGNFKSMANHARRIYEIYENRETIAAQGVSPEAPPKLIWPI